jgi:hypothetical protein
MEGQNLRAFLTPGFINTSAKAAAHATPELCAHSFLPCAGGRRLRATLWQKWGAVLQQSVLRAPQ